MCKVHIRFKVFNHFRSGANDYWVVNARVSEGGRWKCTRFHRYDAPIGKQDIIQDLVHEYGASNWSWQDLLDEPMLNWETDYIA